MPESASFSTEPRAQSTWAVAFAALAATLASSCCVLPLVLALVGVSGAWIANLRVLAPFSTALTAIAIVLLAFAGRQLYKSPVEAVTICSAPDAACSPLRQSARRWFWLALLLTLIPIVVPLLAPYFY